MFKRILKILAIILLLLTSISSIGILDVKATMKVTDVLEKHKKEIISSARKTGVWASVTAAQMILESGATLSTLAEEGNNLFGIKWAEVHAERYPGAKPVLYWTKENIGGSLVSVQANFTHFPSMSDSITEHSIIWWNGYYEKEVALLEDFNSTRDEFLHVMANGAYCTATDYEENLKAVIQSYGLDELDTLAFPEGRKFTGFGDRTKGEYRYPNDGYNDGDTKKAGSTKTEGGKEYVIVSEENLVGMYPTTFLREFSKAISLPGQDTLTTKEKVNMNYIKTSMQENEAWRVVNTARGGVIFVGIFILVYAVLLWVSWLFDRSNNLVEVSLVQVITLGHMEYSDEDEGLKQGIVNKARLVRMEIALFLCGFFIVSGSFFSFLFDVYIAIGMI